MINIERLTNTQFQPRTFDLPVPALIDFLDASVSSQINKLDSEIKQTESDIDHINADLKAGNANKDGLLVCLKNAQKKLTELSNEKLALIQQNVIWTVRGLTACEIAQINESVEKHKLIDIVATALAGNAGKAEQLKELLGVLNDDTPRDFMMRCSRLMLCSVNPTLDLSQAIIFSQAFPIEFQLLTNKILELTGMGMDVKKF